MLKRRGWKTGRGKAAKMAAPHAVGKMWYTMPRHADTNLKG